MLNDRDKKAIVAEVRRRWPEIRILFLTNQPIPLGRLSSNEYRSSSLPPRQFVVNCRQIIGG
jgi:hypothetical protein